VNSFPERDWKQLRKIKDKMLASVCEIIFKKMDSVSENRHGREHEAYLELWKVLQEEDEKIAEMFNDLKRSNALNKLANCRYNEILSDEDLSEFSQETQNSIEKLCEYLH
jgi:hypothetical protein